MSLGSLFEHNFASTLDTMCVAVNVAMRVAVCVAVCVAVSVAVSVAVCATLHQCWILCVLQ